MGRLIDLTGQKFGRLTALSLVPKEERPNQKYAYWLCKCDCGTEKMVESYHLRKGQIQSCGCYSREQFIKYNKSEKHRQEVALQKTKSELGNIYGQLLVIDKAENRRYGAAAWKCRCSCGNEIVVSGKELRTGDTQSCGCLKSTGEAKIIALLQQYQIPFEKEKTFDDCFYPDTQYKPRFDFFVNNSYLIEYDGEQHFNKQNPWYREGKDEYKTQWAQQKNIPLIRIKYTELKELTINNLLLKEGDNNAPISEYNSVT